MYIKKICSGSWKFVSTGALLRVALKSGPWASWWWCINVCTCVYSLCWSRILPDGQVIAMTRSFHPATDSMRQKFEVEFKYTIEYGPLKPGGYIFALNIIGLLLWSIELFWHTAYMQSYIVTVTKYPLICERFCVSHKTAHWGTSHCNHKELTHELFISHLTNICRGIA